jgi:RND family efflux transporter MFP subunit
MNPSKVLNSSAGRPRRAGLICAGLLLLAAGCGEKKKPPPPLPEVTVATPVKKRVITAVHYTGTTRAVLSVNIRARVEGFLQKVHFQPDSRVKKGQLLFTIDPRPFVVRLQNAQADLAVRRAELKLAEATVKRMESALAAKAVSEVSVLQAQANVAKARAQVDAARAGVNDARINLGYTRITSPIDGVINRNLKDVGNLVGAGEKTLLATVVTIDPMYAYFTISERDVLRFREMNRKRRVVGESSADGSGGGSAVILLGLANEQGYPHRGVIDYSDTQVDSRTGTIQLRGRFPNPNKILLPGLFARVRIPLGEQDALLVPEVALGADQAGRFLLVLNDKSEVERRTVVPGVLEDGLRVIEKGLRPSERVIVKGLQRVRPGLRARVVTDRARAAKAPPAATKAD